jgi:cell division protease FtsH
MNANFRNIAIGATIALAPFAILLSLRLVPEQAAVDVIPFSRLLHEVDQGHVHDVIIEGPEISGALFVEKCPSAGTSIELLQESEQGICKSRAGKTDSRSGNLSALSPFAFTSAS